MAGGAEMGKVFLPYNTPTTALNIITDAITLNIELRHLCTFLTKSIAGIARNQISIARPCIRMLVFKGHAPFLLLLEF